MVVFEVVVALLLAGAALAAVARRMGAPYPALVALAGAALALVPGAPTLVLDPELALALFVAPVLVDAAFDASPRDLRANWRQVTSLALGAVALTIAVVAVVAHLLVPTMPWAAAIALGAIVAPPDAAAATTVLKQLRPPYRLLVILEGESLFNDASALLVYRMAVGATLTGVISRAAVVPTLLGVTVGSVALGLVLARVAPLSRWRCRPRPDGTPGPRDAVGLSPRAAAVVAWCGMRGTVTLAAALALPTGGDGRAPFPYRDLILVTAFGVVLGTLVVQGLTVRPLLLHLKLEDDGSVGREVRFARVEALRAALAAAETCPGAETAAHIRQSYTLQLRRAEEELGSDGPVSTGKA